MWKREVSSRKAIAVLPDSYFRANLKRWSELVAKKKQESQQNERENGPEGNDEKQDVEVEKTDEVYDEGNNVDVHETSPVPPENDEPTKKTLVDKIKSEGVNDISFSSDDD